MESEKEGDVRVPLVFAVFFLCVTSGGVFLVIYVFAPSISEPWYPAAALFLIGAPWIFWFVTFLYTVIKRCCAARLRPPAAGVDHQISRRPSTASSASGSSSREPEMPLTNSV